MVRELRGGLVEGEHRGHAVQVDASGSVLRVVGDPGRLVHLRAAGTPFGVVPLLEAGGAEAFDLTPDDIALLAGSHSGEDMHVRTLAALFRRAGLTQSVLAPGIEGMPLDALTSARLARDGERPGPLRHTCSGQHAAVVLLARLRGWSLEGYWLAEHPAQGEVRRAVGRAVGIAPDRLSVAGDDCGLPTYALPLSAVARAGAFLAEPGAVPHGDPRHAMAPALTRVRDAMLARPDLIAGARDRLDTSLMKAVPGRLISKTGMGGLRLVAIRAATEAATGIALKLEGGGGRRAAGWAATVEMLVQAGVVDGQALRTLARYHRPTRSDPHGRIASELVPAFTLAPVGELIA